MSPTPHLDLIIAGIGIALAIALMAYGAAGLVKIANELKARVDGYAELPVADYVDRTSAKIARASLNIGRAPGLISRARVAQRDTMNAFANMTAVLTTPASLWRLGEVLVTGETRS